MEKKARPTGVFIGVLVFGFILYFAMKAAQPNLGAVIFDYNTWFDKMKDNAFYRILWMIGDGTEPHFHKTIFGGLFLLIGSAVAYFLDVGKSKYSGMPISYGTGLWPWILLASMMSLGLSIIFYGGLRNEAGWVPTFVPYVCVASAIILIYGGNFTNALTGAVLGAICTTPITIVVRQYITAPSGLPGVIGSVTGMWVGGIIVFEVCSMLPWMKKTPPPERPADAPKMLGSEYAKTKPGAFFIRRMLADYSEPVFVGNEIAGAALVVGSLLTWLLNPMQPYYGTGWFPALLLCQIITGAVAVYAYWDTFTEGDGIATFIPVVSVAPGIVLTYGPSMFIIVFSAIAGGLFAPPIGKMINCKIPGHWGGMVGTTFSMAFCTFVVGAFVKYIVLAFPWLA